jgi:uracil-DNA glycosylase
MDVKIDPSWKEILQTEFNSEYFEKLASFVKKRYSETTVFPPATNIFKAFELCPVDKVKVVILGQDPYHGKGQANGLSFSVNPGIQLPPSLQNIYKELKSDLGIEPKMDGDLTRWAEQGVLLLNATLTVEASQPGSHQNLGWEIFTDAVIKALSDKKENIVFILWGAYAQRKGEIIDSNKHFVIKSAHPSPFSAHKGFFGTKPFSKTNEYLRKHGTKEIDW